MTEQSLVLPLAPAAEPRSRSATPPPAASPQRPARQASSPLPSDPPRRQASSPHLAADPYQQQQLRGRAPSPSPSGLPAIDRRAPSPQLVPAGNPAAVRQQRLEEARLQREADLLAYQRQHWKVRVQRLFSHASVLQC